MRTELAVLDHNNLDREQATTADGTPRFNVVFPVFPLEARTFVNYYK